MGRWREIEDLQKKRAELDNHILSVVEREQNFLEMLTVIIERIEIQEENLRRLEEQLKERNEVVRILASC